MSDFHGVRTSERSTSLTVPSVAESAMPVVFGTAPVQMANVNNVNTPVLTSNYSEAATNLGYSSDWEKYTLCEFMKTHFVLYNMSPAIFINVLNPEIHKKTVEESDYPVVSKTVELPVEVIRDSLKIRKSASEFYVNGTDYVVTYDNERLYVNIDTDGEIPEDAASLKISFDAVAPELVGENDIIGGVDINTGNYEGLELIERVFPKFTLIPGFILAPGFSHNSMVASVMRSKAENINGIFKAKALIDVDTSEVRKYSDVTAWKNSKNIVHKEQIVCWPMVSLENEKYHLSSHIASLCASIDHSNGSIPYETPSNKKLNVDGACLADGREMLLDLQQANYLNKNGVVTELNFMLGWTAWGNTTACYPGVTDVKDCLIPVRRMFDWVSNTLIKTYWQKIGNPVNKRRIDSIVNSVNMWLNGLMGDGYILGGRVEFHGSENSLADLLEGKVKFRIFITPPSPAQEIEFVMEYDVNYVISSLAG